jgi:hypothetical protein
VRTIFVYLSSSNILGMLAPLFVAPGDSSMSWPADPIRYLPELKTPILLQFAEDDVHLPRPRVGNTRRRGVGTERSAVLFRRRARAQPTGDAAAYYLAKEDPEN